MYTLIWVERALDELADLYVTAAPDERSRMAVGVEALNRRLKLRPLDEGESRGSDRRLTLVPLLAVRFRVDLMSDTVRVVGVNRYGK